MNKQGDMTYQISIFMMKLGDLDAEIDTWNNGAAQRADKQVYGPEETL